MAIVRWEPFSLRPWRHWPRWLDEDWGWPGEMDHQGLNVYETEQEVVIEAAVPGIPEDQVEVTIEGDLITIRGEAEEKEEDEKKKTYYRKMEKKSFCYTTSSPRPIEADKAEAVIEDGMVTVRIPKVKAARPAVVKVKKTKTTKGKK